MNIVVNTRLLVNDKLDGIGIFTRESLKRMVLSHPEHQFYFLFNTDYDPAYLFADNVEPVLIPPYSRDPITLLYWFEWAVPKALKKLNADVFLSPEPTLSLRTDVPSICVIHDLNYEHFPDVLPFHWRIYYRGLTSRFARRADRIATVSRYSRDDIAETYGIPREEIDIVYNGAPASTPKLSDTDKQEVRDTHSDGNRYFYFVGTQQPRKNIANLFRAFDRFKEQDAEGIKLLMIGRKKWWDADMNEAWNSMRHKEDVISPGRLDDQELARIASASIGLVFVPFFEGFGIPILEAFAAHTAVITADITSMPEVAGNAALMVDPYDIEAIAEAMSTLSTNEARRSELIELGRQRTFLFTWERTASLLWESISTTVR